MFSKEPKGVKETCPLLKLDQGKRVLVYFSDNITSFDFSKDVTEFQDSNGPPGAVLLVREVEDASAFGVCVLDESGNVTDIVEKPRIKFNLQWEDLLFDEDFQ